MNPAQFSDPRRDDKLARIVDIAVLLKERRNSRRAAAFLQAYGASFRLTVRVLAPNGPRRRARL